MKADIKNLVLQAALACALGFMASEPAGAQTFTALHNFGVGGDSGYRLSTLVLSSNVLYGTAYSGGSWTNGMVFSIKTDGTAFTVLHTFSALVNETNSDGAFPDGGLVLSDGTLYGTTEAGGNSIDGANGTVFSINTNGTGFTTLHMFDYGDGAYPTGSLVQSGDVFYGTTSQGGANGYGSIFKINGDGTDFATIHSFSIGIEGYWPTNGLILSGNTLYGTAFGGNSPGWGSIFAFNVGTTNFSTVYSFSTSSVGQFPVAGIILSGDTLYGTTSILDNSFSSSTFGSVFSVNIKGGDFTTVHSCVNSAYGWQPYSAVVLSGNTLYGTAAYGGTNGGGTVFAVTTNGASVKTLHTFDGTSDGCYPLGGLILAGNTLYGTTQGGNGPGGPGNSTIFSLTTGPTPPQPPYISVEPSAQTVTSGDDTIFSVTAGGTAPLSYQWQFDSTNLSDANGVSGSTNNVLILRSVTQSQAGTYVVIITNSAGSIASSPVVLTVNSIVPPLTITLASPNVILAWPVTATGFTLESATNLFPSAVWTPVAVGPVVVNGQNTVTLPISGTENFYELGQ